MALLPSSVSHERNLNGCVTPSCCVWLLASVLPPCRAADALLACLFPPRHCHMAVMATATVA
jgi:hypothetical protein